MNMVARSADRLAEYLHLARTHPRLFVNPGGNGFTILLDAGAISRVEAEMGMSLEKRGHPREWAEVGIVFKDQYILMLRDAVRFPDGSVGTYIRIVDTDDGARGVAVLPVCDGKVVILRHFRHATREWHLEIPRGFGARGSSSEESARRELLEETGGSASRLVPLGPLHVNTGISSECVDLFYAEMPSTAAADAHEAITEILRLSQEDFREMIGSGRITDSFTIAAHSRASFAGFL